MQQPKTIACPSCGNINAYAADECMKCGLALGPIREALDKVGTAKSIGVSATPEAPKPQKPVPPLPRLPPRPVTKKIGDYVRGQQVLIRGMGDRANQVAAYFAEQLSNRGIQGLTLRAGTLIREEGGRTDSRDYWFVEHDLGIGNKALTTMVVRITPIGTDLVIEWRHYDRGPQRLSSTGMIFVGVSAIFTLGITILLIMLIPSEREKVYHAWGESIPLTDFQRNDSDAFQLTVRAALEEAIDLAGISKSLIQSVSKDDSKERRLI